MHDGVLADIQDEVLALLSADERDDLARLLRRVLDHHARPQERGQRHTKRWRPEEPEVHGLEQAWQGDHGESYPLPAAGHWRYINCYDLVLVVVLDLRPQVLE